MNRAHVIDCLLALGLICAGPALAAADDEPAPPQYQPVAAKLLQTRQGLGNVLGKLAAGQEVRIAYFGGSITAANGWRPKTMQWFAEKFPAAKVEEINAAIGGTGSDLGVFRLEHDVLRHRPDLVFVEFAVNDGGASPQQIWRSMEGIVRQIWTANPRTDICFVYTFRVGYEKDLAAGSCLTAASAMEMLAEHYGIPSINVALKTVELQQAGKLVFQSDEPSPAGVIRFSQDGVHPLDEGHQIYTDVIAESLKSMQKSPAAVDHAPQLAKAFVADHWQAAKMAPISEKMLSGEWTKLDPEATLTKRFGERMGTLWETRQPGSKLTFKFRGSIARLYDLLAPDGGQVIIRVDGETRPKPVPRFDSYCTYERIATLSIAENLDREQVHTISIEVHPDQPDRSSVAFRLQNPEVELKQPKYQGTNIRASQILLLGDLVE